MTRYVITSVEIYLRLVQWYNLLYAFHTNSSIITKNDDSSTEAIIAISITSNE